ARFDDQVAHAELLDERHHLLLRAGADRQHRHDGRDAEDHPEHREQRPQLVRAEVLEAEPQLRKVVGRPEMTPGVDHDLPAGLAPPPPPARSLAGTPGPAPFAWLARCRSLAAVISRDHPRPRAVRWTSSTCWRRCPGR